MSKSRAHFGMHVGGCCFSLLFLLTFWQTQVCFCREAATFHFLSSCFLCSHLLVRTRNVHPTALTVRSDENFLFHRFRESGFTPPHTQVPTGVPPGPHHRDSALPCLRLSSAPHPQQAKQAEEEASFLNAPLTSTPSQCLSTGDGVELFANSADTPVLMEMFSLALPLRGCGCAEHRAPRWV